MKAENKWLVEGQQQYKKVEKMKASLMMKAENEWPVDSQQ